MSARGVGLGVAGLLLAAVAAAGGAHADPVCVDVEVTREQAAPIDPLGPPVCQDTPWRHLMDVEDGHQETGLPAGTPNGYVIKADVPFPEGPP